MAVRTGESGVSEQQLNYLEIARSNDVPERDMVEILTMISRDDDILSGSEPLHPDWLDIYAELQAATRRFAPPSRFRRLDEFFTAARPFDPGVSKIDPSDRNASSQAAAPSCLHGFRDSAMMRPRWFGSDCLLWRQGDGRSLPQSSDP